MKRVLIILMACVLCLGLVGGAFAYFTDTETSTGNTFTAGTLDLKVDADPDGGVEEWVDDPNVPNVNQLADELVNNLKPGDTGTIIIGIKNAGSIDGVADIHIKNLVNYDNGGNEPEISVPDTTTGNPGPGEGELGANVMVTISYDGTPIVGPVTLDSLNSVNTILGPLNAGATASITIVFTIPGTTGNIIQSDSVVFDVEFSLNQA